MQPEIIVLFVSYRCNCKCIMCAAWKKNEEMTIQDAERLFSNPILQKSIKIINITGGEPTLKEDLVDCVRVIVEKCPGIKKIDLSTNGVNTDQVLDKIEQIAAYFLIKGIKLGVSVSLDGIESAHDKIRGVAGAFKNIDATIDRIKELSGFYPISLGLNSTINRMNYSRLNEILDYAALKPVGVNFTLAAISEIAVESYLVRDSFELKSDEKDEVFIFVGQLIKKRKISVRYGGFLQAWLKKGIRYGPCAFKSGRALLIEPDGSLYRCGNFKEFKLGNILNEPDIVSTSSGLKHFGKEYVKKCLSCNSNCYIQEGSL
jgi:MoaA/NifB/PqqE/SkfB family radical SAM enzyme